MKSRQLPSGSPGCPNVPGAYAEWVLLDKGHDLAGVFAAYPAPFVPPDLRRNSGPGRVDHLHHHAPVALYDHPTTRATSKAIVGLYVENQTTGTSSDSDQMEALQTDEQITPIITIKRRRAAGRVRHRPRSLKTSGLEARSSSGTSTSIRNSRPCIDHSHSTRKNPLTPDNWQCRAINFPATSHQHRMAYTLRQRRLMGW